MAETTEISWAGGTWNPWHGCTQVSPGCANCYMARWKARFGQEPWVVVRSGRHTFRQPLRMKKPTLIFTCSLSDWFHEAADVWRDEAWEIIRQTPHHTYQILTKRPERIREHLPADWGVGYPNVWLGVSVENQRHAFRAEMLAQIPARVRFISAEPLLGPLDLTKVYLDKMDEVHGVPILDGQIHWVIVGGESGPEQKDPRKTRPLHPDWARSLRDQCLRHGVAFHFKQWGGATPKSGGRLLDGREWLEFPTERKAAA